MSEGRALVRFHDWRAARDRKAVTRRLWRSRCIGLVAVPVSIGLATPAFFLIPPPQPNAVAENQRRAQHSVCGVTGSEVKVERGIALSKIDTFP